MTELARLKFYATQAHPCSYLPTEQATTLFLDPSQPMDAQVYAELSEMGFRRSGDHLYRPHCQRCTACVPARMLRNFGMLKISFPSPTRSDQYSTGPLDVR